MRPATNSTSDVRSLLYLLKSSLFLVLHLSRFISLVNCLSAPLREDSIGSQSTVTLCIDTVFYTVCGPLSASITAVCGCILMIWKSSTICGRSLLSLALFNLSAVLVLPISGRLSTNSHWLGTYMVEGRLWHCSTIFLVRLFYPYEH